MRSQSRARSREPRPGGSASRSRCPRRRARRDPAGARAAPRRSPAVSSTASVVCVRQATGRVGASSSARASSTSRRRACCAGASPTVPSTSSWSAWPTSTIWKSVGGEAARLGVDLGDQRAGRVDHVELARRRRASRTAGETPCAEKITVAPGGHLVDVVDEHRAAALELVRRRGRCARSACARRPGRRAARARARRSRSRASPRRTTRAGRRARPRAGRAPRAQPSSSALASRSARNARRAAIAARAGRWIS